MRQTDRRLPDQKLVVMQNPFGDWADTERVVLVPPYGRMRPDPLQQAHGTVTARIAGLTFADVEQAKAANTWS